MRDGKVYLDLSGLPGGNAVSEVKLDMIAGNSYSFVIGFTHQSGYGRFGIEWKRPDGVRQFIPSRWVYSPPAPGCNIGPGGGIVSGDEPPAGSFKAFPNPFGNDLNLEGSFLQECNSYEVLVHDLFGRIVFRQQFGASSLEFRHDIELDAKLPSGMYQVKVLSDSGESLQQPVIKN